MYAKDIAKGIVALGGGRYRIIFRDCKNKEHEIRISAISPQQLADMFERYCETNNFPKDTVKEIIRI